MRDRKRATVPWCLILRVNLQTTFVARTTLRAKRIRLLQARDERTFRKLWEMSELSANDFADKVAEFFKLPRVGLPDLLAAPALAKQFSPRFLREMSVFPYRSADGDGDARRRRSERFRRC